MYKIIFLICLLVIVFPSPITLSPTISWILSVFFIAEFLAPTMVPSTDGCSILIKGVYVFPLA